MPKKTKIIFISVFIIVGIIIFLIFSWLNNKNNSTETNTTPWYQNFNPFGSNNKNNSSTDTNTNSEKKITPNGFDSSSSRFFQITNFGVAGATYLDDTRPIVSKIDSTPKPEPIKTIISSGTTEGRKEIQGILNQTLSLNPPLTLDGSFGKLAVEAIKKFQKLNNIPETGIIDIATAPYFTKILNPTDSLNSPRFETVPSIRYVEKSNGHVYKMYLDTKAKDKISNSTIPGIYEAFFDSSAQSVIYRYLSTDKTISSYLATLGAPKGEFLSPGITDLSLSNDKTKYFFITDNKDGSVGTIRTFGTAVKNIVFSSPFTEWLSQWGTGSKIYLTTKPSYAVSGNLFALDTTNMTMSKILSDVIGLTTLVSPDQRLVLYNTSTANGPKLSIFDTNDHTSKDLNISSLPEKCVWSNDSINVYCSVPNVIVGYQYPDYWYQGLVSFDDFFIKINVLTLEKTTLANSIEEKPVDATHLFLSKAEDYIFFINKKDSSLWSFYTR